MSDTSSARSMNIRLVYIYEDKSGYAGAANTINSGLAGAPDTVADMATSYSVVNVAAT